MTVRVVDDLEVVEVDEQQRQLPWLAFHAQQRLGQSVDQQYPVRQPGQRIVHRLVGEFVLCALEFGDFAGERNDTKRCPILGLPLGGEIRREPAQVFAAADREVERADVAGE